MGGERNIARVGRISAEDFQREYVLPGKPVLIEGAVSDWPALRTWGADDLRARFGDVRVPCLSVPPGQAPTFRGAPQPFDTRPRPTVAEYLAHLETRPNIHDTRIHRWYLNNVRINNPDSPLAALARDVPLPPLFDHRRLESLGLFIGYDTFSVLHYHPRKQALAAAIVGKKKILLWSPEDFDACYPPPWHDEYAWASGMIDPVHPDAAAYPRFVAAQPLEAVIEPGLLLFIPVHWFHLVTGMDFTINLTMFWRAQREECRPALWRRDRLLTASYVAREKFRRLRRRILK